MSQNNKGYFLMIEASRIDYASHAHDGPGHLGKSVEYNKVMDLVKTWIDGNPDTMMISVADHEIGGLTLPSGYNVRALAGPPSPLSTLPLFGRNSPVPIAVVFLTKEILPAYGITGATDAEISALLSAENFTQTLADTLNSRGGLAWSTGGHSGADTTLSFSAMRKAGLVRSLRLKLAGNHDNIELPRFIEEIMRLDMDKATRALRAKGTDWVP